HSPAARTDPSHQPQVQNPITPHTLSRRSRKKDTLPYYFPFVDPGTMIEFQSAILFPLRTPGHYHIIPKCYTVPYSYTRALSYSTKVLYCTLFVHPDTII